MRDMGTKAERIAEIDEMIAGLKEERTRLEGEFIAQAEDDIRDSKRKTAYYAGNGIRITATMIDTVKLVYPTLLKQYAIYSDMVTEDKQYKLTDPGKRLLGGIADKAYMDTSIEDVLRQSVPTDKLPQLLKKVRGKVYATDVKNIKAILECSDEDADAIAYMVAEAATWSEFDALCRAHKISDGERAELIDTISNAVVVIRSPKIKAERMESK